MEKIVKEIDPGIMGVLSHPVFFLDKNSLCLLGCADCQWDVVWREDFKQMGLDKFKEGAQFRAKRGPSGMVRFAHNVRQYIDLEIYVDGSWAEIECWSASVVGKRYPDWIPKYGESITFYIEELPQ